MKLKVENLSFNIKSKKLLDNININVKKGSFVGLIGPNGCGKTTLLKNIYRCLTPTNGTIYIDDKNIYGLKNKELSKHLSVVMQENSIEFDFTIGEIVAMGRFSSLKRFEKLNESDEDIIQSSLKKVGLENYKNRSFLSLSGGEKQRVMIAVALCQKSKLIILDEPTNHLDIKYQLSILNMLKSLDITVFTTIHDMNLASTYCDYIYVMKSGKVTTHGKIEEVFTKNMFNEVFEVNVHISNNPYNDKLNISYINNTVY